MEKDIALGPEGAVSLKLEAGKLIIELKHVHASGAVSLVVAEDASYFLDKLAVLIPGVWDDAVIALAKDAMKRM